MVATYLEARLALGASEKLITAYHEATRKLESGIERSYLLQDPDDPMQWRIVTLWENREAIERMKEKVGTPRGILIFRAAGAEPTFSVLDVALSAVAA
jgi:hypothetical protein